MPSLPLSQSIEVLNRNGTGVKRCVTLEGVAEIGRRVVRHRGEFRGPRSWGTKLSYKWDHGWSASNRAPERELTTGERRDHAGTDHAASKNDDSQGDRRDG